MSRTQRATSGVLLLGCIVLCFGLSASAQPPAKWQDTEADTLKVASPCWLSKDAVLWAADKGLAKSSPAGAWQVLPVGGSLARDSAPLVAPGGRHVALLVHTEAGAEVWLMETTTWRVVAAARNRRPVAPWGRWGAWSPDGAGVCFASQDNETPCTTHLEFLRLHGQTEAMTQKGDHLDSCPGFLSASQVVFSRVDYGRTTSEVMTASGPANVSEVMLLDMRSKQVSGVTAGQVDRTPAVSPSGAISFVRLDAYRGQAVYVLKQPAEAYPLIGDILTFPMSYRTPRAWIRNESQLVVQSGSVLYAVSVPAGEATRLQITDPVDGGWAISSDGNAIAYASRGRGVILAPLR